MSSNATPSGPVHQSAFGQVGGFVWRFLLFWLGLTTFVLIGYMCSVVVEWIGMTFWWEDEGIRHSENMYQTEHTYISRDLANGLFKGGTLGIVENTVDWTYQFLTPSPGGYLHQFLSWMSLPVYSSDWNIVEWGKRGAQGSSDYVLAARNIALVYVLRLTIIALTLPLFVAIVHHAMVDGLTQRERRKAGGGIESGFVYHHMKKWRTIVLLFPLIIYLASPIAIHPNVALVPIAMVIWVLNYVFFLKFKKNV